MGEKILFLRAKSDIKDPSPPMAFSYLGKIAKDLGFEVLVENLNAQYNNKSNKDIIELIKKQKPLIVGLSIFTNLAKESYKLMREIRPFCNVIVVGGPHATICPEEILERGADISMVGEAEVSFKDLLETILKNKSLRKVKGIVYKDKKKGKIIKTKPQQVVANLDKISDVDIDVHRKSDYMRVKEEMNNFGEILSSRGCPGRCTYCFHTLFGRGFRFRSAGNVFNEISYLHRKYRVNFINFVDDAFTINRKRLMGLCELFISEKLSIRWACTTRVDFLDREMIFKMKEAGCKMIMLGVESNIPETLLKTRKTGNPEWYTEHSKKLLKWCHEAGIRAGVNILSGFPWESAEDIKKLKAYVKEIKPYVTQGFGGGILQPMPNTEIYDQYAKKYKFEKWWLYKKLTFGDNYRPFFAQYYYYYWDHLHNNFFKFDKKVFRAIDNLYKMMGRWHLYVITRRRFKNPFVAYFVYTGFFILSKFSLFLFSISPKLEKPIMEKLKKFSYRFKFRKGADNLEL